MYEDFDLGSLDFQDSGIDAYLNPPTKTAAQAAPSRGRVKVASLQALAGFERMSSDTLIHKSKGDLWKLQKDASGEYYIEQLFDPAGDPVRE